MVLVYLSNQVSTGIIKNIMLNYRFNLTHVVNKIIIFKLSSSIYLII